MKQELLDKMVALIAKDPDSYQKRSGDDSTLNRFYELFPLESIASMTLEQYCLGAGSRKENFSWWLEGGLQKAIGSYSPGNAKGHLIYLKKDGDYYMHRYFSELGPEKAMEIVRKSLYAIASCSTIEEARVVDDDQALAKRAGLEDKKYVVNGDARTLRILSMYHPDWMLPINSIDHLKHFLKKLSGEPDQKLPEKSIELVIKLLTFFSQVKQVSKVAISPYGFSKLLYSEELGIVPPKRDNNIDEKSEETKKAGKAPWWRKFFNTMEQGHAAFDLLHEVCMALGVTDSNGATAQKVSLTNLTVAGKERLRLNFGNTLVFEIKSPPLDKPNACFIARIQEQDHSLEPEVKFNTPYAGQMHGLYRVNLADLLEKGSTSRQHLLAAVDDVASTHSNIKQRRYESAHRPRILNAVFNKDKREQMLMNGPTKRPEAEEVNSKSNLNDTLATGKSAKNLIMYGPPGTGKTYSTIDRALEIIDPDLYESSSNTQDCRAIRKARFDELLQGKRIGFVTFHQSFSYEDFVEGLKASTDEKGQVKYEVEDGIFKQMCIAAAASSSGSRSGSSETIDIKGRAIWKMSLGNTLGPDASIYNECIENGYVLLGWGQDIDFTGASTRDDIKAKVKERKSEGVDSDYTVTACHAFVNTMKPGDLIIVSDGNHKFRAIGVVKGDYRFLPVAEDREQLFQQCRDVEWVRTYFPSLPSDQLMTVAFSQMSLYRLKPPAIDLDLVQSLLSENEATETGIPRPFVLIIDEINRGNISRVFGELITLVEDSKRAGEPEALSVKLPYSKEMFSVPSNLHLIGTMNTADRSLAQVDIALRRRFVFEELMPDTTVLKQIPLIEGIDVARMLTAMNSRIEILYDREHTIGHAFFISLRNNPTITELEQIFVGKILPLLEEYFFEDWEKIRLVLGDHQKPNHLAIIQQKYSETQLAALFGQNTDYSIRNAYQRNQASLKNPACYVGIYEPTEASANVSSPSDL